MKKIREINYLEERRELIIVYSYSDGLSVTVLAIKSQNCEVEI